MKNSIKTQRKKLRLSQEELAIKASVTRQTIIAIENDKYDPSLGLAFKLAYVLQTSIETLFIWKDDQND
ncbi:helix-turn-helix transcriptional regulator [Pediococcus ethanolidurans]|uniref:helix-turn-helix transcriptional regulator n=1 Tax=Pediococcus ethanolidurans TaxID=319653 RepID=UPI0021AA7DED|nr:helix-turn-helix transcriptional regulator [Pediococcus ethanolidurans]MCT4397360.1 transcriptional regulator [Pediococcus ethanolidurans]MCV3322509.1 helix-turn-helix transcriptional regulator [Pediococcus ethanolidurans]MCV3328509.1 helix-turn-helix transcriptional regulator [Pediococcus ethanolidurans]